jgi:hypothetical protein
MNPGYSQSARKVTGPEGDRNGLGCLLVIRGIPGPRKHEKLCLPQGVVLFRSLPSFSRWFRRFSGRRPSQSPNPGPSPWADVCAPLAIENGLVPAQRVGMPPSPRLAMPAAILALIAMLGQTKYIVRYWLPVPASLPTSPFLTLRSDYIASSIGIYPRDESFWYANPMPALRGNKTAESSVNRFVPFLLSA